jgi:hypothetical protein
MSVNFTLKNYGNAPALNVQGGAHCQVFDRYGKQKPISIQQSRYNPGRLLEAAVIMPQNSVLGQCITADLDAENSGELKVEGQISALDIFHAKHHTKFCYTNAFINEHRERSLSPDDLTSCLAGNEVD